MAQVIHNISTPNDGNGDELRTAFGHQNDMNTELYTNKVDKVAGKGLSSNDFTNPLKSKLDGIEDGAQVNVQPNFAQNDPSQPDYIINRPTGMISTRLDYGKIVKIGKGFTVDEFDVYTPNVGAWELDEKGDVFMAIDITGRKIPYMRYSGEGDVTDLANHFYESRQTAWLPGEPEYVATE